MIERPRAAWAYEPGGEYAGEVRRVGVVDLPALRPAGLTAAVKIAVLHKIGPGGTGRCAPEGTEIREYLHFDGALRPACGLARRLTASLPAPLRRPEDLGALVGLTGRLRVGAPVPHSGYNPVTAWRTVRRSRVPGRPRPTRGRNEFRVDGTQFVLRFDTGGKPEQGHVRVISATQKIHAILRAAPRAVTYAELDGTVCPAAQPRSACRVGDEAGLRPAGGPAGRVLDEEGVTGCLGRILQLGDELHEAARREAGEEVADAKRERKQLLAHLKATVEHRARKLVVELADACDRHDRDRERKLIVSLITKRAAGKAERSEADRLRERVQDSFGYGLKVLRKAGLKEMAAHLEAAVVAEDGGYRYLTDSPPRDWRL